MSACSVDRRLAAQATTPGQSPLPARHQMTHEQSASHHYPSARVVNAAAA